MSARSKLEGTAKNAKASWYRMFDKAVDSSPTDEERATYTLYMNLIDQYMDEGSSQKLKKVHQLFKIEIDSIEISRGTYDYCAR